MFPQRLEPFKMTEAQRKTCESITDDELIRAAVRGRIEHAIEQKGEGLAPEKIDFPYVTYEDYRAANPDCCRVTNKRTGDASPDFAPFFDGTLEPKIFLVDYTYRGNDLSVGHSAAYVNHASGLVACYGEAVTEDHLRHLLYRAGRPIK